MVLPRKAGPGPTRVISAAPRRLASGRWPRLTSPATTRWGS